MFPRQTAQPAPPQITQVSSQSIEKELDRLSLVSKKSFQSQSITQNSDEVGGPKIKHIRKKYTRVVVKSSQQKQQAQRRRQLTKKKIRTLQSRIKQLERENNSLRRKCQNCYNCRSGMQQRMTLDDAQMLQQEELLRIVGSYQSRNSRDSVQFQAIDFHPNLSEKKEMDERAWVMIGAMMIIMGSKNMDIDGTINTFQVLNNCADQIRRQVQKSREMIRLDFFCVKEEMKQNEVFIQGLDFDPFFPKTQRNGLQIQSIRLQSAEPSQLIYDQKLTLNIKYQSLIRAMENLKENCWMESI